MLTVQKPLKVGKTDTYSFTVSSKWLVSESIVSATITVDSLKVTYNSQTIVGDTIYMSLTGVEVGSVIIEIEYTTATRTDCDAFRLVLEDC